MGLIRNKSYPITAGMSETEKNLGVDLKLNADGDLALGNIKDFKLVAGAENAAQALRLKLEIERGSLLHHPQIGSSLQIGEKTKNAFTLKSSILSSILTDPRFQSARVNVSVVNGTYVIELFVRIVNTDAEIPLKLALIG